MKSSPGAASLAGQPQSQDGIVLSEAMEKVSGSLIIHGIHGELGVEWSPSPQVPKEHRSSWVNADATTTSRLDTFGNAGSYR